MFEKCECESTEFDEYRATLDVTILKPTQFDGPGVHPGQVKQRQVWTRFCKNCGRVSFWSKPAQ